MKYTLPDVPWAGLLWGIAKDPRHPYLHLRRARR